MTRKAAGVDGLLVVDLPPEECASLREPREPTRPRLRAAGRAHQLRRSASTLAADVADAFVYYVSLTGVTGSASADFEVAAERAKQVNERTKKPVAVGFGVTSGADVRKLSRLADGVVVGSALVRAVEESKDRTQAVERVRALVRDLATGLAR